MDVCPSFTNLHPLTSIKSEVSRFETKATQFKAHLFTPTLKSHETGHIFIKIRSDMCQEDS